MGSYRFGDLNSKVAVITGGSNGIGLSIVKALVSVGVRAVILSRNSETASKAIEGLAKDLQKNVISIS